MGRLPAQFKIIERGQYEQTAGDLDAARRNAAVIGPLQKRIFIIDLSKWEFCEGKTDVQLQDFTIYVYTPVMLVLEKIRAICQQMPEYPVRTEKVARAKDFYDIYILMNEGNVELATPDAHELAKQIFAAKDVPLRLISRIPTQREFHRQDWHSVQDTVAGRLEPFDFYFDFVVTNVGQLKPLWDI